MPYRIGAPLRANGWLVTGPLHISKQTLCSDCQSVLQRSAANAPVLSSRVTQPCHSFPIFVGKRRLCEIATGRFESPSRDAPAPVRAAPAVNALPVSSWMVEIECL